MTYTWKASSEVLHSEGFCVSKKSGLYLEGLIFNIFWYVVFDWHTSEVLDLYEI